MFVPRSTRLAGTVVWACVCSLAGCAFFTVRGDTDGLDCTRSYATPIIDGLVTAAVAGTIVATRNAAEDDCNEPGFGSCAIKESAFPLAFGGTFFALSSRLWISWVPQIKRTLLIP